ncbi:MAG TPA: DNA alkylation repair protein, partial [Ktedonobacterales bacterium]|nr:DNA alkylation repair protein [Ktedonobacterales bacterium]
MNAEDVRSALHQLADPLRAKNSAWFFKTGPGQYGEGDQFIGVTVPAQRKLASAYIELPLPDVLELLRSAIHEHRLTALFILVYQYRKGDQDTKKHLASFYHNNRAYVNNWDLVDSSAPYILGDYIKTHSPNVLFRLAAAKSIWDRRIAIISTFAFIRDGQFDLTLKIAEMLLNDKEDLIHKATGWALREVGKKDHQALTIFLDQHAGSMPRTALRYAIERFSPEERRL